MAPPPKAVRFSEVVKKSGSPYPVTLWTDPGEDPELQKAIRQNRVLTVEQGGHGSKVDFGMVGFRPEINGAYLVFPKSLAQFAEKRIVGIKYDLVETPSVKDPAPQKRPAIKRIIKKNVASRNKPIPIPKPEPKLVKLPKFKVKVERIAISITEVEVIARNSADAKKDALKTAETESLENGNITYRVKAVSKVSKE